MFNRIKLLLMMVCCLFLSNNALSATTSTLVNSSSYTQVLGPGGTGYLLSAYQPMQCSFATTIPSPTVIGHTLQQMQQISIDSIGSGVYLWCKSNAAGLNYATTTAIADAATWGNSTSGGGGSGNVNLNQVGGVSYALGQTTMSASMPVTVSSNQTAIPISAASLPLASGAATNAGIIGISSKTLTDINTTLGTPLQAGGNVVVTSAPTTAVTNAGLTNIDVALSTRLKPADTLAGVTAVGSITSALPVGTNSIGQVTANAGSGTFAISAASLPLPSFAATSTKQADGTQKTQVVDGSGNVIGSTSNALDINIKSGNPTTIAATQSGTWTVQPGNTANTTAWKVDGSAVTQPVSGTITTNAAVSTTASNAPTNVESTAYEASHVLKASAGILYGLCGYNSKSSAQFVLLFNSTTVPADTAVPDSFPITVPAASNWCVSFMPYGKSFTTGISVSNSSTGPTKTVGSADVWFSAGVK